MLWYKSWLETRWRFVIGLVLLMLSACGTVLAYPAGGQAAAAGAAGRCRAERSAGASRKRWSCRATTAATSGRSGSGRTCRRCGRSLRCCSAPAACSRRPPGRRRCSRCRCRSRATACSAFAPRPAWRNCSCSPSSPRSCCRCSRRPSGRRYSLGDALVHGAVHVHRGHRVLQPGVPALDRLQRRLAAAADCRSARRPCWRSSNSLSATSSRYSLFRVMSGETYFRGGGLPWLGLLASAAVSAAMLYAATRNIARQDF